jgi:hypothetical protein
LGKGIAGHQMEVGLFASFQKAQSLRHRTES